MLQPLPLSSRWPEPEKDRVLILVNPRAGAQSAVQHADRLGQILSAHGFQAETAADLGQVATQANAWHAAGTLRALVGVGGDGTAAELVNRTAPGVPIAMLPAGTENLLARYAGWRSDAEFLAGVITAGHPLRLDAGRAGPRIFLLMASAGFDADVVHRVHAGRRGHIPGRSAYFAPILRAARDYPFPEIRVTWDPPNAKEQASRGREPPDLAIDHGGQSGGSRPRLAQAAVRWFFCFNLPCYGGGLQIARRCSGDDGLLDVCTFDGGGLWRGLQLAAALKLGCQGRLAHWRQFGVRRLRLESDQPVPYQLDGDPGGHLPLDLEILPGRLCLLIPRKEPVGAQS